MNAVAMSLPQLTDLTRKAAVVTGAGKGIGRAIAVRLAEAGAKIVVVDADPAASQETIAEIERVGSRGMFVGGDVADPRLGQRAVDTCVEAFGRIDVLVNNAGIFPSSPALKTTEELWDKVIDVNLKGAFFFSQHAARRMIDLGIPGSIVQIASIDALHPSGNLAHYDASKAGLVMLTKSLANELGKVGIRVNVICPGGVATPGAAEVMGAMAKEIGMTGEQMTAGFAARVPLGRMGDPDDIARAALFFASPMSSYCTGSVLVVDGGYLAA